MKKVRISGAGISGLSAAITLANNGVPVEVYEKLPLHTWMSTSKGVQAIRNYESEKDIIDEFNSMGIRFARPYPIYRELRYSPSLKRIEISSKDKPIFYCVSRNPPSSIVLDLYEKALDRNVKFRFGATSDQSDIIATGARERMISVFAYHYEETSCDNSVHIFMNNDYAPQGYLGILPYHDREMTIGVASSDRSVDIPYLKTRLDRFLDGNPIARKFLNGAEKKHVISGYEYFSSQYTIKSGESILAGEAAGFMDASRGFGLTYAVKSGYMAARSIIDGIDYDDLWKRSFGEEMIRYQLRRSQLASMTNDDYERTINDLISGYGPQMPVESYSNHKNRSLSQT